MISEETKQVAIRSLRQERSELLDKISAHLRGDARKAFEDWMQSERKESFDAEQKLAQIEKALKELEATC